MFFLSWLDLRDPRCQTMEFLLGEIEQLAQWLALLFLEWHEFGVQSP